MLITFSECVHVTLRLVRVFQHIYFYRGLLRHFSGRIAANQLPRAKYLSRTSRTKVKPLFFQLWLPDVEVLNLKMFRALDVLSKLQGLWVSQHSNILYVLATRVTFICAMSFDAFPLDVQTCLLQVSLQRNLLSLSRVTLAFCSSRSDLICGLYGLGERKTACKWQMQTAVMN